MIVEIVVPLIVLSALTAYSAISAIEITDSSTKFYLSILGTIILVSFGLLAVTGYIRPFYSAYIVMVIWIIIQRLYLVRSPNGSMWTSEVQLE